jgi:hypothetical protein
LGRAADGAGSWSAGRCAAATIEINTATPATSITIRFIDASITEILSAVCRIIRELCD